MVGLKNPKCSGETPSDKDEGPDQLPVVFTVVIWLNNAVGVFSLQSAISTVDGKAKSKNWTSTLAVEIPHWLSTVYVYWVWASVIGLNVPWKPFDKAGDQLPNWLAPLPSKSNKLTSSSLFIALYSLI